MSLFENTWDDFRTVLNIAGTRDALLFTPENRQGIPLTVSDPVTLLPFIEPGSDATVFITESIYLMFPRWHESTSKLVRLLESPDNIAGRFMRHNAFCYLILGNISGTGMIWCHNTHLKSHADIYREFVKKGLRGGSFNVLGDWGEEDQPCFNASGAILPKGTPVRGEKADHTYISLWTRKAECLRPLINELIREEEISPDCLYDRNAGVDDELSDMKFETVPW